MFDVSKQIVYSFKNKNHYLEFIASFERGLIGSAELMQEFDRLKRKREALFNQYYQSTEKLADDIEDFHDAITGLEEFLDELGEYIPDYDPDKFLVMFETLLKEIKESGVSIKSYIKYYEDYQESEKI